MVYDINGNPISTDGKIQGVEPIFNTASIYQCENPDGMYANFSAVYSAYDSLFSGLNVDKNLLGYGTNSSGGQDATLPIYEYVIHNPNETPGVYSPPLILLTSGVHGDEKLAVSGLFNVVKSIVTSNSVIPQSLRNALQIRVVPVVNPGGYNNGTRNNRHNVNINRNFGYNWASSTATDKGASAYSEYETKALKAWADAQSQNANVLFMLDFHNQDRTHNRYFYFASNCQKMQNAFAVVYRGMYSSFLAQGVDLADFDYIVQEGNSIAGLAAEFYQLLGVDAAIMETPYVPNTENLTYIRHAAEIDGNYIHFMVKNCFWEGKRA